MTEKKRSSNPGVRQRIGRWGEKLAAEHVIHAGFDLVEQNARTPEGEIDLVVRSGSEVRFIEVKTRTSRKFGYPEEAVEGSKFMHMQAAAEYYLTEHPELDEDWHLDIIAILGKPGEAKIEINWIKDAEI